MKKFVAFLLLLVLVFTSMGCLNDILPTTITISCPKTTLVVEEETTASAAVTPDNAAIKEVTWTSSNPAVVMVTKSGSGVVIKAVAEGTADIKAVSIADSSVYDLITITVNDLTEIKPEIKPTGLIFVNVPSTLTVGGAATLEIKLTPINATNQSIIWTTSDETVATVSETGIVSALKVGTVTITATSEADSSVYCAATIEVTRGIEVLIESISVTGVCISDPTTSQKLSATIFPATATNKVLIWTSNDDSIATVDANGNVTPITAGIVTISALATDGSGVYGTFTIIFENNLRPASIAINGENFLYIGYPVKLTATVYPLGAVQNVIWLSANSSIATVSSDGTVIPLKEGMVIIKAISTVDNSILGTMLVTVMLDGPCGTPDLHGYEILIMQAESALHEIDPFLEQYTAADKLYKQAAWNEVQTDFDCKITVVGYPPSPVWGVARVHWLIENAIAGTAQMDLGMISSSWIHQLSEAGAAVDVTEYYHKYGKSQMEPTLKDAGSYDGKLYVASTGMSPTATYVNLGLYYNMTLLEKSGAEDPAKMFNEGNWTYSKFVEWVKTAQAGLDEDEKVLGGHPYYYWLGMTNAAGQKIGNTDGSPANTNTTKSKDASALIYHLVQAGCVNTTVTWAEGDGGFIAGKDLMSTGELWFAKHPVRWQENMWGSGTTSYGYVPFPYPDDMAKEDTRISVTDGTLCYMYSAGRQYPQGVEFEYVYQAVNAMFLKTIENQKADPYFDAQTEKTKTLAKYLDNPASIVAAMYYDASKVFFDPAHAIYISVSSTPFITPTINVLFKGMDYDEAFNVTYDKFNQDIMNYYSK